MKNKVVWLAAGRRRCISIEVYLKHMLQSLPVFLNQEIKPKLLLEKNPVKNEE